METSLFQAFELARKAHAGQLYNDEPYINHCIRVCFRIPEPSSVYVRIVALLHDVIEDTDISFSVIKSEFDNITADAVFAITRQTDEAYNDYIARCAENYIAATVKYYDLEENIKQCYSVNAPPKAKSLLKRYVNAYNYLSRKLMY